MRNAAAPHHSLEQSCLARIVGKSGAYVAGEIAMNIMRRHSGRNAIEVGGGQRRVPDECPREANTTVARNVRASCASGSIERDAAGTKPPRSKRSAALGIAPDCLARPKRRQNEAIQAALIYTGGTGRWRR